ncbi:MAG: signal peptide peptidase SppA [Candidatus Moraniibacteriota bacterium]
MTIWEKLVKAQKKFENREPIGIDLPQKISNFFNSIKITWLHVFVFITAIMTVVFVATIFVMILLFFPNLFKTEVSFNGIGEKVSNKSSDDAKTNDDVAEKSPKATNENCNSIILKLQGPLVPHIGSNSSIFSSDEEQTSSEDICYEIEVADKDEKIKAIIVEVDSPGGIPLAAEEIEKCIGRSYKPVLAYVRSTGTSAAYWAITSADRIFASSLSDIGSIGVYISYLDNVKKNEMDGLKYHLYSTGKFKDMLSSDKPTTKEEEILIMEQLQSAHDIFVNAVSENRKIGIETVRKISDGRVFDGEQANLIGLIDQIGGLFEVKKYIENNYLDNSKIETCEW